MVFLRLLLVIVLLLALLVGGVWLFWPREPVDMDVRFDAGKLNGGVDAYLAAQEAGFADITPGVEKRVVWADAPEIRTEIALVYIHGFSATSEEIRPVPDLVAEALGANLFYTRLAGHGRSGDAMAEPRVRDWAEDMAEALAVGQAIGDRVVVMTTSTGGTLATLAATRPEMAAAMDGLILVSPNFRLGNPAAEILTWPAVRLWGPIVAGAERSWEPQNADHGRYWTTAYPTIATIPMGALVKATQEADHGAIQVPALAIFDPRDGVVNHEETAKIAAAWGGPMTVENITTGPNDDPLHHVIAGAIMSPDQTQTAADLMTAWIRDLP